MKHLLGSGSLLIALTVCAHGTMSGSGYVQVGGGYNFGESGPIFSRVEKRDNSSQGYDGKAASVIRMDFGQGIFAVRGHACAGPAIPSSSEVTEGNAKVGTNLENFSVTSSTLAANTPVTITFCLETTVQMRGVADGPVYLASNEAVMRWAIRRDGSWVFDQSGYLRRGDDYSTWHATGMFAPFLPPDSQTQTQFTIAREVTINTRVGGTFNFLLDLEAFTRVDILSGQQGSIGDGTAAIATTVGVDSMTEGVTLVHSSSQNWLGTCGGSVNYLPPNPWNPVPEPGTVVALSSGLMLLLRRRTRS